MPRGGRRPGAGKPKGYKHKQTLDKEAARQFLRARVIAELGPLVEAQIAQAKGLKYLVTRDKKTGKFIRITEAMARHKSHLADNEEIIEVWEKDPSVPAFMDLLNRALDKPIEAVTHDIQGGISITWQQ
jgi:hypothetical protein